MWRRIIKSFYSFQILGVYIFTTIFISTTQPSTGFYLDLPGAGGFGVKV